MLGGGRGGAVLGIGQAEGGLQSLLVHDLTCPLATGSHGSTVLLGMLGLPVSRLLC